MRWIFLVSFKMNLRVMWFLKNFAKLNFKQRMQYKVKELGNGMNKEVVDRGSGKNVYRV